MSSSMEYEYLTAEERLAMLRPRIASAERDHYAVRLDIEVAGPGGNPAQETRLSQLEDQITNLKQMAADMDTQVQQAQSEQEPAPA